MNVMDHHSIPYDRNPYFTGRKRLLAELDTFFVSALPVPLKIVALVGMPGIGKTEIALEYAYRMWGKYQAIIWLDAPSRHQLAENISQMLGMKLSWKNADEREQIFGAFREWLWGYQSSFLLVLNQIGNDSLLNDVLDDEMVGHAIMTKSSRDKRDDFKLVIVKPFDKEEGPLFLLRRAGLLALSKPLKHAPSALQQAASAIHEEFGGHPLTLDQVGAYVSETGMNLAGYLPLYRKDRRSFLDRRGTDSPAHPFSTYAVIAAMRQGSAYQAQELLFLYVQNLLDCSDPYPRLSPTRESSLLRQQASDHSTLFEMRAALIQNFLLVPLDGAHRRWDLHPLVRTVMLEVLAYEEEQSRLRRAQDDLYEPIDLEGVFQVLVEVQQMKHRQATLEQNDPEKRQLARAITTMVHRLQRAVLPASPKKREQAKTRIEYRYSVLAYSNNSPLITASQNNIRQYAQDLLALMQYR